MNEKPGVQISHPWRLGAFVVLYAICGAVVVLIGAHKGWWL